MSEKHEEGLVGGSRGRTEGAAAGGLSGRACQAGAAGTGEVVVGPLKAMREDALAEVQPDPLDHVEFG